MIELRAGVKLKDIIVVGVLKLVGKLLLVDDDGQPINKVDYLANADSDNEVDEVFNETASFMASTSLKNGSGVRSKSTYEQSGSRSGYGTKSLLEQ
nr:hypothetical protein [Tanacetum cinerariifolium]